MTVAMGERAVLLPWGCRLPVFQRMIHTRVDLVGYFKKEHEVGRCAHVGMIFREFESKVENGCYHM